VTALYEIVPAGSKGWLSDRRYTDNRRAAGGRQDGEMAFVRLRYKLPDGNTSRLIERPVAAPLLDHAARPSGDTAFVTAVAAFGQKLRGDTRLATSTMPISAGWRYSGRLWRQEFLKLTELAEAGSPSANRPVATEE